MCQYLEYSSLSLKENRREFSELPASDPQIIILANITHQLCDLKQVT